MLCREIYVEVGLASLVYAPVCARFSGDVELLLGWSLVLSCACRLHSEGEVQAEEVMISFGPVMQHVADV